MIYDTPIVAMCATCSICLSHFFYKRVINTKCLQTCASIRQRSYLIQNTIKEILTFIVNNIIMPFALFLLQILVHVLLFFCIVFFIESMSCVCVVKYIIKYICCNKLYFSDLKATSAFITYDCTIILI